jgi:hypothetical protein
MSTSTIQHLTQDVKATLIAKQEKSYRPLDEETRSVIPTKAAAFHCNRQPQTLRAWACLENGPIRPIRINGRLAWSVSAIRNLLNGGE